jgi:hypothetical protein
VIDRSDDGGDGSPQKTSPAMHICMHSSKPGSGAERNNLKTCWWQLLPIGARVHDCGAGGQPAGRLRQAGDSSGYIAGGGKHTKVRSRTSGLTFHSARDPTASIIHIDYNKAESMPILSQDRCKMYLTFCIKMIRIKGCSCGHENYFKEIISAWRDFRSSTFIREPGL